MTPQLAHTACFVRRRSVCHRRPARRCRPREGTVARATPAIARLVARDVSWRWHGINSALRYDSARHRHVQRAFGRRVPRGRGAAPAAATCLALLRGVTRRARSASNCSVHGLCALLMRVASPVTAQQATAPALPTKAEQEVLALSLTKWRWMSEKRVDALAALAFSGRRRCSAQGFRHERASVVSRVTMRSCTWQRPPCSLGDRHAVVLRRNHRLSAYAMPTSISSGVPKNTSRNNIGGRRFVLGPMRFSKSGNPRIPAVTTHTPPSPGHPCPASPRTSPHGQGQQLRPGQGRRSDHVPRERPRRNA